MNRFITVMGIVCIVGITFISNFFDNDDDITNSVLDPIYYSSEDYTEFIGKEKIRVNEKPEAPPDLPE